MKKKEKITISFKAAGTLSDYILDGRFFLSLIQNKEFMLNGTCIPLQDIDNIDYEKNRKKLQEYEDIKKVLDILGVTEELEPNRLSIKDTTNIRNLVNAILYNKKIRFIETDESWIHGAIKIANLSIWIWATKREDGYYQIDNFFSPHQIAIFENTDFENTNPIPASQYLLLSKEAFVHASNMDYEKIKADISVMEHHIKLLDATTNLLLNILRGYDLQTKKEDSLLDLADSVCDWLAYYDGNEKYIVRLNQLQIIKRRRPLSTTEIIELGKLTEIVDAPIIKCGAYLLLGEIEKAQQCFDELSTTLQGEFLSYPICVFGNLKMNGGKPGCVNSFV